MARFHPGTFSGRCNLLRSFQHRFRKSGEELGSTLRTPSFVGVSADVWVKVKNPAATAVKREAEEDWR